MLVQCRMLSLLSRGSHSVTSPIALPFSGPETRDAGLSVVSEFVLRGSAVVLLDVSLWSLNRSAVLQ